LAKKRAEEEARRKVEEEKKKAEEEAKKAQEPKDEEMKDAPSGTDTPVEIEEA